MKNSVLLITIWINTLAMTSFAEEYREGVLFVNAIEANEMLREKIGVEVLDIRTEYEFSQRHIEGAVNIDFYRTDFKQRVSQLDPSKTYLLHCRSGGRSNRALNILKSVGITNLVHLDGGMKAWQKALLPTKGQP